MSVILPANYDARFIQLREDGSFEYRARINHLRLEWDTFVFEVYRGGGYSWRGPRLTKDHRTLDLTGFHEIADVARLASQAITRGEPVLVPTTLRCAGAENTNTRFFLLREHGVSFVKVTRSRKKRFFVYLPEMYSWVEADSDEVWDIWNANTQRESGDPAASTVDGL